MLAVNKKGAACSSTKKLAEVTQRVADVHNFRQRIPERLWVPRSWLEKQPRVAQ